MTSDVFGSYLRWMFRAFTLQSSAHRVAAQPERTKTCPFQETNFHHPCRWIWVQLLVMFESLWDTWFSHITAKSEVPPKSSDMLMCLFWEAQNFWGNFWNNWHDHCPIKASTAANFSLSWIRTQSKLRLCSTYRQQLNQSLFEHFTLRCKLQPIIISASWILWLQSFSRAVKITAHRSLTKVTKFIWEVITRIMIGLKLTHLTNINSSFNWLLCFVLMLYTAGSSLIWSWW